MKAVVVVALICTVLLLFSSAVLMREVYRLQSRMVIQEDNYKHLLHRANAAEYWEVLPRKGG